MKKPRSHLSDKELAAAYEQLPPTWTRALILPNANKSCSTCWGSGIRIRTRNYSDASVKVAPCPCVYREIFSRVMREYRRSENQGPSPTQTRYDPNVLKSSAIGARLPRFGFPHIEFRASAHLVAMRAIEAGVTRRKADSATVDQMKQIFKIHIERRMSWRVACPIVGIDRGNFFHAVYDIQEAVGKAFAEAQPYPLFPISSYYAPLELVKSEAPMPGICSARGGLRHGAVKMTNWAMPTERSEVSDGVPKGYEQVAAFSVGSGGWPC